MLARCLQSAVVAGNGSSKQQSSPAVVPNSREAHIGDEKEGRPRRRRRKSFGIELPMRQVLVLRRSTGDCTTPSVRAMSLGGGDDLSPTGSVSSEGAVRRPVSPSSLCNLFERDVLPDLLSHVSSEDAQSVSSETTLLPLYDDSDSMDIDTVEMAATQKSEGFFNRLHEATRKKMKAIRRAWSRLTTRQRK